MYTELANYIIGCIQPVDETECSVESEFHQKTFDNLKQDGLYFVSSGDRAIPKGTDYVCIGQQTIIRKNSPKQIEWLNEDGTVCFDRTNVPIYRRLVPPPWETVNHTFIIGKILELTNPDKTRNYVEYGVRSGENFEYMSSRVNFCYGVDISPYRITRSNMFFYKMLTDDFSKSILKNIQFDYAFIDADHSSQQAFVDFEYIFERINKGGYIFLHDTYPCMEQMLHPNACNDCYKTPLKIREKYGDLVEILTLPLNPGLTIVRKL